MSIYGIGTAGYPMTGYEPRKTPRSATANNYTNQMSSVTQTTQMSSGTFELHISNDTDGEAVGATCGSDYSVTVYQPKDFDPSNPVYKVKVWDKEGNVTERMVDVSKVDTRSGDFIDMFAYTSHLSASGEYPNADSAFMGADAIRHGADGRSYDDLFQKTDWLSVVRDAMQMQFEAKNLEGYMEYKRFLDFLEP